jgi:hypothetical protein
VVRGAGILRGVLNAGVWCSGHHGHHARVLHHAVRTEEEGRSHGESFKAPIHSKKSERIQTKHQIPRIHARGSPTVDICLSLPGGVTAHFVDHGA